MSPTAHLIYINRIAPRAFLITSIKVKTQILPYPIELIQHNDNFVISIVDGNSMYVCGQSAMRAKISIYFVEQLF